MSAGCLRRHLEYWRYLDYGVGLKAGSLRSVVVVVMAVMVMMV